VTSYGARGDGVTDATSAILAAIAAARGQTVNFPAGAYYLASTLTVPNGAHLAGPVGAGPASSAWLKGAVVFGSSSSFADLKIGDGGVYAGCRNASGATSTEFTRCQFRGGAGGSSSTPLHLGGGNNSCSHITFTDCTVERSLTNETPYPYSGGGNCVDVNEVVDSTNGAHIEYLTFNRCHFGVSNGRTDIPRNIGAVRMMVEMTHTGGTPVRHGYHDITFSGCIFEAANGCALDIAGAIYNGVHTDAYVTVEGCEFRGAGYLVPGSGDGWGYDITDEGNNHVTITDCDFYPSYGRVLTTLAFGGVTVDDWAITGNRFHLEDRSYGCARGNDPAIHLEGTGKFTGNTIINSSGSYWLLWLGNFYDSNSASGCSVTGNTFRELRAKASGMATIDDATNCTITGNTFQTAATSDPTLSRTGTNTGTTIADNVLLHN
jgi:hypothetical protein